MPQRSLKTVKHLVLNGFFWSITNQLSLILIGLAVSGVLARLITPAEFGIIGMVSLGTGFLNVIKDFGFGAALVQKKEVHDDEYSTVFWINLIIGFLLCALVYSLAPLIGHFFKESRVEPVTKALSFTFLLNAIGIVWNNKLIKAVAFKQIFYRSFLSTIISGGLAVFLAYRGYGVWALVAQTYSNIIINTFLVYLHIRWLPRLTIEKKYVISLFKFGLPLLADQSINYWVRNIDNLLVGRFLGKETLAYYGKAYTLMLLPVSQLTGTLTKVLFPTFSMIQDDQAQIAEIYLKISRVIALIAFPLMTGLSLLAEPLILIVYGPQWHAAVPIFQVLSLLGMLQAIAALSGDIYLSQGKTALMFKVGLVSKGCMIIGIVSGLFSAGLMGMVYGYCITSMLAFFLETYYLGRLIRLSLVKILLNIAPYLGVTMLCLVLAACGFRSFHFSVLPDFIIKGLSFALIYLLLCFIFRLDALSDILKLIRKR